MVGPEDTLVEDHNQVEIDQMELVAPVVVVLIELFQLISFDHHNHMVEMLINQIHSFSVLLENLLA